MSTANRDPICRGSRFPRCPKARHLGHPLFVGCKVCLAGEEVFVGEVAIEDRTADGELAGGAELRVAVDLVG